MTLLPVLNKHSASRGAGLTSGTFIHFSHFQEACKSGHIDCLQSGWIKAQGRQFYGTPTSKDSLSLLLTCHHSIRKLSWQVKRWALETTDNTPPWKAKAKAHIESVPSMYGIYKSPCSVFRPLYIHGLHLHVSYRRKTSSCLWRVWLLQGDKNVCTRTSY